MKKVQRFDVARVKARFDENGFLVDTPIVARIGAQTYQTPKGPRVEFRPASEVFDSESLESFRGKPITLGHTMVNAKNAKSLVVGSCSGAGKRDHDGVGVLAPVTVYDEHSIGQAKKKIAAELSVGYTSVDIDRKGWGNNATGEYYFDEDLPENFDALKQDAADDWVRFDAVQTCIRVNHIALVFKGRAGIAKLNLDSEQEFPYSNHVNNKEEKTMIIKLDGVEVEVSEQVGAHIAKLDTQIATAATASQNTIATLTAERDQLQVKVDGIPAAIEAAVTAAKEDAKALSDLVAIVGGAGIKTDGLSTKELKIAYVKEVAKIDVSDKDDVYIDASFDVAQKSDNMAQQRLDAAGRAQEGSSKEKEDADEIPDPQARFRK